MVIPERATSTPSTSRSNASVRSVVELITDDDAWEHAIGVVRRVGNAIATTMSGELGGPFRPTG